MLVFIKSNAGFPIDKVSKYSPTAVVALCLFSMQQIRSSAMRQQWRQQATTTEITMKERMVPTTAHGPLKWPTVINVKVIQCRSYVAIHAINKLYKCE